MPEPVPLSSVGTGPDAAKQCHAGSWGGLHGRDRHHGNVHTGNSGYWIATSAASGAAGTSVTTGGSAAGTTFLAGMTAPTAAGTYYYKVWANKRASPGAASSVLYSTTVATAGAADHSAAGDPAADHGPTGDPARPRQPPPVAQAQISSLSPAHAVAGTKITIRGTGFGAPGSVKFGTVTAKASSWTRTAIVVTVPATSGITPQLESDVSGPVWYCHAPTILMTETPKCAAASNAVSFLRILPTSSVGMRTSRQRATAVAIQENAPDQPMRLFGEPTRQRDAGRSVIEGRVRVSRRGTSRVAFSSQWWPS